MNEKMIKISAVFKLQSEDEVALMVEMTTNYDAEKASLIPTTKIDIYNTLKQLVEHQVGEGVIVLDATAEEVKEHYET